MKLTPDAVDALMEACLSAPSKSPDSVVVEGIISDYAFHPGRIAENEATIAELLAQLPDEFQAKKGGGWSFLNACQDRDGSLWTGEQRVQESLLVLGIAAGKARWLLPREVGSDLPGGVPYVVVN